MELSDQVTAGKVAADALYVAGTAAPTDAFTWTPAIPSAGSWRILVRWPASSANTAAARYTVTHAGGTTAITLNQKQNGGIWTSLGSYSLTPGAGHKVTLAASTDGTTIADAVLVAGPTVQPANLLYVHPDHLGSPQKLTDTTQATVWDGVFDPFENGDATLFIPLTCSLFVPMVPSRSLTSWISRKVAPTSPQAAARVFVRARVNLLRKVVFEFSNRIPLQ